MLSNSKTPFLPSPAVPYIRVSLLLVTRWKPLPPRHYCDTQAQISHYPCSHSQGTFARRGYSVRLHYRYYVPIRQSDRFLPISDFNPYTGGLCHSRVVPDYQSDLPQFNPRLLLYMPSSLLRLDILMPIVCFFSRYCGLRPKRRGSTPVTMSTPISTGYPEDTSSPEAAMFALCYSLYSCSLHRIGPLRL